MLSAHALPNALRLKSRPRRRRICAPVSSFRNQYSTLAARAQSEMETWRNEAFRATPVFFSRTFCPYCHLTHKWFAKHAWVSEAQPKARRKMLRAIAALYYPGLARFRRIFDPHQCRVLLFVCIVSTQHFDCHNGQKE